MTSRAMLRSLFGVLLGTLPASAWAATEPVHGHGAHDPVHVGGEVAHHGIEAVLTASFWATAFGFVVAIGLVVFLLRKQVSQALSERRERVLRDLEEAKALYEEAERRYEEYATRLEHLDEELQKLREQMVRVGQAERDRLVAEAEKKAARLRAEAEQAVARRVVQLQEELRREAARMALQATEEALREGLGFQEQQRLVRDYLGTLEKATGETASRPSGAPPVVEGRP